LVPANSIKASGHNVPRIKAGDMTAPSPPRNNIKLKNLLASRAPSRHDKPFVGMNRWVGLGVIADNLVNIGCALQAKSSP
jgi:hypothetical protein